MHLQNKKSLKVIDFGSKFVTKLFYWNFLDSNFRVSGVFWPEFDSCRSCPVFDHLSKISQKRAGFFASL